MWVFLLLVGVPILEIALFIQVGGWLGTLPTILIVIATALAGTVLLRRQGLSTMASLRSSLSEGRNPVNPIAHGAIILVAGVLLLTPGFFTDALGLSFLVPAVRTYLIKNIGARISKNASVHTFGVPPHSHPHPQERTSEDVVDADFEVVEDVAENAEPGNSGWTKPRN